MTSFALGLCDISHAHKETQLPTKSGISLVHPQPITVTTRIIPFLVGKIQGVSF